ncbi:hypothetical protein F5887DRAFT_1038489, partial [Amanita rubescens]
MSSHADSHTPSREESYNRLSAMSLNSLRHYASHFLGLPSTDCQNKHDLVLWFLQNSSQHILNLILSFAESRDVRDDRTRRKRVREPVDDDDSERDVVRVRHEHQPPNPSVFLELPSDAEIKTLLPCFLRIHFQCASFLWRLWCMWTTGLLVFTTRINCNGFRCCGSPTDVVWFPASRTVCHSN